jgi:NH3-dependent NAD+ synthetase
LDRVIEARVEESQSIVQISSATGYDRALVERICRMIDIAEYKRRQAAVGLKITSVAFGSGRRMPIAQKWRG